MAKICLDAGHSGTPDPGAVGPSGVREADVALDICYKLERLLENDGHTVIMTRTESDEPATDDLGYRVSIANGRSADIFISIHCNSASSAEAHGTETYYFEGSSQSRCLAEYVQSSLVNTIDLADRGLKDGSWLFVLKRTNMPAILTEIAFINNPTEESLLVDDLFQNRAAAGIFEGIRTYLLG